MTQFYKLALDNALPFYNVHGGTQDNGSQMGPSRTLNANGISNADWIDHLRRRRLRHRPSTRPTRTRSTSSGRKGNLLRYDRKSHETVYISPRPGAGRAAAALQLGLAGHRQPALAHAHLLRVAVRVAQRRPGRLVDEDQPRPHAQHLPPRAADHGPDRGAPTRCGTTARCRCSRPSRRSASRRWSRGSSTRGPTTGSIQVTEDGGKTWRKIEKLPGVPDNFFVNEVKASRLDKDTVFAAVDSHKTGDYKPYLLRSDDRGRTWTSIAGDLPARAIVWSVAQDHVKKDLLFAGTEFGIYATLDGGETLGEARRRRADDLVPRHRDPGARERPGGRVVRPQLLRARRLLAAAPDRARRRSRRTRCSSP